VNLEVDLGSVSNFYNGANSGLTLTNLVTQDLIDTYGADWASRTDLFWAAAATDGNAGSDPNGTPASTLWATGVPGKAVPLCESVGLQGPAATRIATMYQGDPGSLNGAASTTNSSEAAVIGNTLAGSWSAQETSGESFDYFSPKIDGQVSSEDTLNLYELQPSSAFPHPAATLVGTLTLTSEGLSFQTPPVPDPFVTWQSNYFTAAELENPAFSGPNADPLGKGISNTNQFLAGFNPTNNAAYPHIISLARIDNGKDIQVTYLGANGDSNSPLGSLTYTNILDYTTGTAGGGYSNINFATTGVTNILSGGGGYGVVTTMIDVGGATNRPSRYYRVRVLVP
jgi:hypothetical protein